MLDYISHISFTCPECGNHITEDIAAPDPFIANEAALEDTEAEGEAYVRCKSCNEEFTLIVLNNAGNCTSSLFDYPSTLVNCSHAEIVDADPFDEDPEDNWSNFDIPDNPLEILQKSIEEAKEILQENRNTAQDYANSATYRMVLVLTISSMESYLQDTITKFALFNEKNQMNLIANDKELRSKKFNLFQIMNEKDIVKIEFSKASERNSLPQHP